MKRNWLWHSLWGLALWAFPETPRGQSATTAQIIIDNVPDNTGTIRVALCTKEEFLEPICRFHAFMPSRKGQTTVNILIDTPGLYAVQVFQDRDNDGQLQRNFLGIPREPIGFSRNPVLHFGPPAFSQCALVITDNKTIHIALKTH